MKFGLILVNFEVKMCEEVEISRTQDSDEEFDYSSDDSWMIFHNYGSDSSERDIEMGVVVSRDDGGDNTRPRPMLGSVGASSSSGRRSRAKGKSRSSEMSWQDYPDEYEC